MPPWRLQIERWIHGCRPASPSSHPRGHEGYGPAAESVAAHRWRPAHGKGTCKTWDTATSVSADCRHIYEKVPIMHYIRNQKPPKCPIAGCPRVLQVGRVTYDCLLQVEIDELRSSGPSAPDAENIEDLTDDEDDSNE